jgi:hypothetical protein
MASETIYDTVQTPAAEPFEPSQQQQRRPVSEAQMNANRLNAQKAKGATSEAGRAASSMNALTHGLCSMKALLPGDSAEAYENLVSSYFDRHNPQTDEERELVHVISNNFWRLLKVPVEEQALIEDARYSTSEFYPAEKNPVRRAAMLEGALIILREKQLRNIRLHERRIRKQIADDTAKLKEIQKERIEGPAREAKEAKEENQRQVTRILGIAKNAAEQKVEFVPSDFGFDLSVSEFEQFRRIQQTHFNLSKEVLDIQTVIARVKSAPSAA